MYERVLGYVVVEYNQASRCPSLWHDGMYGDEAEAREFRDHAELDARGRGRMEHYTVARVVEIEDADV